MSKITPGLRNEITRQSDVTSKPVRDNFTNYSNAINDNQDQIDAISTSTTNNETVLARGVDHASLNSRLDSMWEGQPNYMKFGGVVTINTGDAQKVDVTAGEARVEGKDIIWSADTSETIPFTSANSRYDIVVVNSATTTGGLHLEIVRGAESATPVLPSIAETQKALHALLVGTATVALSHDVRDQGCRFFNEGRWFFEWKIQDAIDALTSGGNIFVGRGTYFETITYSNNQIITFEGGTVFNTAAGVLIDFADIDISSLTKTMIIWSGGVVGNGGRFVSGWSILGNILAISSLGSYNITALSSTRIAFIDSGNDEMRTYDFDGTDWSQTGNALSIASITFPVIGAMTSTRIAFLDNLNKDLRAYDFDGTDWAQVGNDLSITAPGDVRSITGLSSTRIAFIDQDQDDLRAYDFDGTDWTLTGNELNIPGIANQKIAALTSSRVALLSGDSVLRAYNFDGTDWTQTGNSITVGSTIINFHITALTSNRIAFTEGGGLMRVYSFDGTDWRIVSSPEDNIHFSLPICTALTKNRIAILDSSVGGLVTFDALESPTFKGFSSTAPPSPVF